MKYQIPFSGKNKKTISKRGQLNFYSACKAFKNARRSYSHRMEGGQRQDSSKDIM